MLTREAKIVLNIICTICNKFKYHYPDEIAYASFHEIYLSFYPKPMHALLKTLEYLTQQGYISKYTRTSFDSYQLEYTGKKYKEFSWNRTISYILKSIIVPIILAIITTLITLWITGYFTSVGS